MLELQNYKIFQGDIFNFNYTFDLPVGLQACGRLTDHFRKMLKLKLGFFNLQMLYLNDFNNKF